MVPSMLAPVGRLGNATVIAPTICRDAVRGGRLTRSERAEGAEMEAPQPGRARPGRCSLPLGKTEPVDSSSSPAQEVPVGAGQAEQAPSDFSEDGMEASVTDVSHEEGVAGGGRSRFSRASSVRLPCAVGVLAYAMLAVSIPVFLGGEPSPEQVPAALLEQQRVITDNGTQLIGRSINEGVTDLIEFASLLEVLGPAEPSRLAQATTLFAAIHRRYESVYVVNSDRNVLAAAGGEPRPELVRGDRLFRGADMEDAVRVDDADVIIPQYSPMKSCSEETGVGQQAGGSVCELSTAVVGHYDPSFLLNPLDGLELRGAWLVNQEGRILATPGAAVLMGKLPTADLQGAARRAAADESGAFARRAPDGRTEVIGFAPLTGSGPRGKLGWSLLTASAVNDIAPANDDKSQWALGFAVLFGVFTTLVFGWLWLAVIRPLDHLEHEADRIAHGDLDRPVTIERHDEIGLVARSLERIRVASLAERKRGASRGHNDSNAG